MRVLRRLPGDPYVYGLIALVLITIIIGFAQYTATQSVNRQSYDRCRDRQINTNKLNAFARRMSVLEAENRFIDQPLRDARVAAYTSLVLASPNCGEKP